MKGNKLFRTLGLFVILGTIFTCLTLVVYEIIFGLFHELELIIGSIGLMLGMIALFELFKPEIDKIKISLGIKENVRSDVPGIKHAARVRFRRGGWR